MFKKIESAFMKTYKIESHIELKDDAIWRYTTHDGEIYGDFIQVDKAGNCIYYDKTDKSIINRKFNLFDKPKKFKLDEFPNDKKMIFGYNCHKVKITLMEQFKEAKTIDFGNTIYEMYVTSEINLPVHAVIDLSINLANYFPLEIRTWSTKLSNSQEVYELLNIEYVLPSSK